MTHREDQEIRIRYQSMTAFSAVTRYAQVLQEHARAVTSKAPKYIPSISPAIYGELVPGDVFPYPYLKHLVQCEALEACLQAEAEGADAFVIGSFSEPLLRQSRSAVDIPVLSLPESVFLTACSLAERFALVTLSPKYARRLSEVVARHGMKERVTGILPLGDNLDERDLNAALQDPRAVLHAFREATQTAIADGADLVIPAEGILNEVIYRNKVSELEGATILDAVGVTLLHAEMQVRMKRKLNIGVGRAWSYPRAAPSLTNAFRRTALRRE